MNELPEGRSAWSGRTQRATFYPEDFAALERPAPRLQRWLREIALGLIGAGVVGEFLFAFLTYLNR